MLVIEFLVCVKDDLILTLAQPGADGVHVSKINSFPFLMMPTGHRCFNVKEVVGAEDDRFPFASESL